MKVMASSTSLPSHRWKRWSASIDMTLPSPLSVTAVAMKEVENPREQPVSSTRLPPVMRNSEYRKDATSSSTESYCGLEAYFFLHPVTSASLKRLIEVLGGTRYPPVETS